MPDHRRNVFMVAGLLLALGIPELSGVPGCATAFAQATDDNWRWTVTPYLWGSAVKTEIGFPSGQEIGGVAEFDEILDKLEIAGQVHVEGSRGEWGMFFDATYLSLSDDGARGPISTGAEIDTGIYEIAALYTPGGESGRFTAIAGARIIDLSLDMNFSGGFPGTPVTHSVDKSFTDFMVGGRYMGSFNDHWGFIVRADIGAGDTDSCWNALAGINWRFGKELDNAVTIGWRHMAIEVEQQGLEIDVGFDGPIAGVSFGF